VKSTVKEKKDLEKLVLNCVPTISWSL